MASGTEIERLFVKIDGDLQGLKASMSQAKSEVVKGEKDMGGSLDKLALRFTSVNGAAMAMGGGVALAGAALLRGSQVAVKYADDLNDAALALGLNVEKLQELRFAGIQSGVAQEELDRALMKLNLSIGEAVRNGGPAAEKFSALGIELKDVSGKTRETGDVFRDVVDKLSKIPNAAERASAAGDLMGDKLGPKLNQMLGQGISRLDELSRSAHDVGAVIDKDTVEKAAAAQDQLDAMSGAIKANLTVALVELAPVLLSIGGMILDVARGAKEASIAIAAMLGKSPFPLEDEINELNTKILLAQQLLQNGQDPVWTKKLKEEIVGLQSLLDMTKAKQLELMQAGAGGKPSAGATAMPPAAADKEGQKTLDAVLAMEQRAYEERLSAQRTFFGSLASTESKSLAERVSAMEKATEAEIALEQAGYARKLDQFSKVQATTDEQKAALAGAREEAELAHRIRLEEIESGSHERIKAMRDREAEEELASFRERQAWFEERVAADEERQDAIAEANAERLKAKIELDQAGLEEYKRLRDEGMATDAEVVAFQSRLDAQRAQAARKALGDLSTLMASSSRKMFEVGKAAAISQTVIDTYAAAQSAYKAMAGIPVVGPALGVAAAAAAIASGLARVQAIKSTSFGNRSVAIGVGGGVAVGSGPGGGDAGGGGGGGRGAQTFISLPGGTNFYSGEFIRELISRINEAQGDGARITVVS